MSIESARLSRGIVGCCIQQPDLTSEFLKHATPDDLDPPYRQIMHAQLQLLDEHGVVNEATLADALDRVPGVDRLELMEIAMGTLPVYFDSFLERFRQGLRIRRWAEALARLKMALRIDDWDHAEAAIKEVIAKAELDVSVLRAPPPVLSARELLTSDFPLPRWSIPNLLPAGLTLFAGPPKVGKSAICLDLAYGVATGGRAMSTMDCNKGDVLYLSLDNDSERRLQQRLRRLLGGTEMPDDANIDFVTSWATEHRALADCQQWVDSVDDPIMVVIDTLVKVEPNFEGGGNTNAYAHSTRALTRWSQFAIRNDLTVVMVHHDRKSEADDWLSRFSGSRGLTATAQTLMMLDAQRGAQEGILRVSGRDVPTDEYALRRWNLFWTLVDIPTAVE